MNTFAAFNDSDDEAPVTKGAKKTEAKGTAAKTVSAPVDSKAARGAARGAPKNKERTQGRAVKSKDGEPRQRQFDRKSGTGRGKEVAKGGHGGWGNEGAEARNAEKNGAVDEAAQGRADAANDYNEDAEVDVTPREPAKPTFTYEEFVAKKNATRANSELFAATSERKASDVAGIQRGAEDLTVFLKLGSDKKQRQKGSQRANNKVSAAPGFLLAKPAQDFEDRPPRRDDRGESRAPRDGARREGGRGGDRREGGRGAARSGGDRAPRAPKSAAGPINMTDERAFPSLA